MSLCYSGVKFHPTEPKKTPRYCMYYVCFYELAIFSYVKEVFWCWDRGDGEDATLLELIWQEKI